MANLVAVPALLTLNVHHLQVFNLGEPVANTSGEITVYADLNLGNNIILQGWALTHRPNDLKQPWLCNDAMGRFRIHDTPALRQETGRTGDDLTRLLVKYLQGLLNDEDQEAAAYWLGEDDVPPGFPLEHPMCWHGPHVEVPIEYIRLHGFESKDNRVVTAHVSLGEQLVLWDVAVYGPNGPWIGREILHRGLRQRIKALVEDESCRAVCKGLLDRGLVHNVLSYTISDPSGITGKVGEIAPLPVRLVRYK